MAITKKLRFEVFKRDGFCCAYCGKSPPKVTLEIDHIEPRSKGGKDTIENLITACFDCNRGKKNIPLSKAPAQLSENLEILQQREEQLKEYRKFALKVERRIERDIRDIDLIYCEQYPDWRFSDSFKVMSLKRFLSLLPKHEIIEALNLAIARFPSDKDNVINYFCGICWNKIRGKNESSEH